MTQEVMRRADLDPTLRPTELTIAQIRALAEAYAHLCTLEPQLHSYEFREELRLKHLSRQHGTPAPPHPGPPSERQGGEAGEGSS